MIVRSSAQPRRLASTAYNYKPAVELTEHDSYYISLDPQIVNRPGTST